MLLNDGLPSFRMWFTIISVPVISTCGNLAADDAHCDMAELREAVLDRYYLNAFERIIYTESHDEVANGKARIPEEVDPGSASSWVARKKSTLGAALVFTTPGIPMIFQGQEFLEDDWFHDQDPHCPLQCYNFFSEQILIVRKPGVFRKNQDIDVRTRYEVTRIDTGSKRVRV